MTYIFKFSSKSYLSAGFLVLFAFAISGCGGGDGGHNCQKICSTGSVLSLTWPNKSKDWCIRKSASASCKWYYAGEPLGNYDFFYRDSDSDGFGNPDATKIALSQPDGYVSNSRDCNDSNADINPGATEVTDGVDNNCDGRVDEIPYYADSDGDLFGNPGDIKAALSQPIGYVPDNTDCNDANAAINPAAIEIGDSIDNNCDGQVDEG
ncbi:MAG: hypothetical protein GY806_14705, partial [Gammaproteobacteria bacterium]|nr:hypothetical protein [Gammaproteobacteria bacterium]